MTTLVEIPFKNTTITATNENGVWVPMKNLCDYFGVNHESERQKLSRKSWATTCKMQAVAEDGKSRELLMMDRQTMTMWLGTLDEKRVSEDVRPFLVDFQKNAANALDSYFHEGGAINPHASVEQMDKLGAQLGELRAQAEIAQLLRGVVADDHLDNVGRIIMARAMGEKPVIAREDRSLTASDFLKEKKVKAKESMRIRSTFGRRLSGAYLAHHGENPPSAPELVNGRERDVKHYTEKDRHLFEQVWNDHYAEDYEPSLMDELA